MKRWNRRALPLLLALLLVLPCLPAPAAAADAGMPDVCCVCGGTVPLQKVGGETWLFLPAAADLHSLTLTFQNELTLRVGETGQPLISGTPFDLTAPFSSRRTERCCMKASCHTSEAGAIPPGHTP